VAAKYLGAHMPTGKGLDSALKEGKEIGCTAVQVFTSSPRMWKSSPPSEEKVEKFKAAISETGINRLISHDTYLVNLCHAQDEVAEKSRETLRDEMVRCGQLGIGFVVSHMGALLARSLEDGLAMVARHTLSILDETPEDVTVLMETTAGQGSAINSKFEEIAALLELCKHHPRLGVCLDTCHIFVAGYDFRTLESYVKTMDDFDRIVGISNLKAIHVNDSKKGLGSRVDRHDNIGKGAIGVEPFAFFMNDERLQDIPMVVETPTEDDGHQKDIETLRSLFQ
jgi:deoxyribonuclease-4